MLLFVNTFFQCLRFNCRTKTIIYNAHVILTNTPFSPKGMFFQWILCSGIFMESVVVQLIQQSEFYPVVMFGGMVWATGDVSVRER